MSPGAIGRLRSWLPPNDDPSRPLLQLATVDETGSPDARSVLLTEWDEAGFVVHTDSHSRKAQHIAARPAVALVLVRTGTSRQLTVQGRAEPAGPERDNRGYGRRSPYLRRLAWVNTQEVANRTPRDRSAAWSRFGDDNDDSELLPPHTWVGFLIRPTRLTFWESHADGPSHREEHRLGRDGWTVHQLPG